MIADFGVATAGDGISLTGAGQLIGTPQYMSPEQAYGNPVDGRSDLYSLGATAFFSLTGRPLFDGPSPIAVVTKHLNDRPRRSRVSAPIFRPSSPAPWTGVSRRIPTSGSPPERSSPRRWR
jgi:serine/threonine-protein kinase